MVAFGLLLLALIDSGGDVELFGVTLPVWAVALVSYLLGWGATIAKMKPQKS